MQFWMEETSSIMSGAGFLDDTAKKIAGTNAKIASLCGRVYAMDREQRYDRLQRHIIYMFMEKVKSLMIINLPLKQAMQGILLMNFVSLCLLKKREKLKMETL